MNDEEWPPLTRSSECLATRAKHIIDAFEAKQKKKRKNKRAVARLANEFVVVKDDDSSETHA